MVSIDFARGAEPYKRVLTTLARKNLTIVVSKSRVSHLLQSSYYRAKERIVKDRKLHAYMRSLRKKPLLRNLF